MSLDNNSFLGNIDVFCVNKKPAEDSVGFIKN